MNPIIIHDIADSIVKLRMFPYFDICNYILMSISVRDDTPQSSSTAFSRRHPFACWFATMLMCFGGAILCNFIMSQPVFSCFDDHRSVLLATFVWYLVNYAPFDFFYRICKIFPIRLVICTLKEIQRTKKISHGVHHGLEHYPDSIVMPILLGILKGDSSYLDPVAYLVLGIFNPHVNPFIRIPVTTKLSLMATLIFLFEHLKMIPLPHNEVFLAVAAVFIYMRLSMICLGLKDPFLPLENILCTLLFGGLVDAMKVAFEKKHSTQPPATGTTSMIGHHHTSDSANTGSPAVEVVSSGTNGAVSSNLTGSAPSLNGAVPTSDKITDKKRD